MATSEGALRISADIPALDGAGETIGDDTDVGLVTFWEETDRTDPRESVRTDDESAICLQLNWVSRYL